jgi:hypothetical protein
MSARVSRLVVAGVALALAVSGCAEVESTAEQGYEPSKLQAVKGSDVKQVTFTAEGAARTGLQTAPATRDRRFTVVPYAALLYGPKGETYVYTSPAQLSYLRVEVEVRDVDGDRVVLANGPPAGTQVVTVGAAEVYGAELEIDGGH